MIHALLLTVGLTARKNLKMPAGERRPIACEMMAGYGLPKKFATV
jgi:hypothetical protein